MSKWKPDGTSSQLGQYLQLGLELAATCPDVLKRAVDIGSDLAKGTDYDNMLLVAYALICKLDDDDENIPEYIAQFGAISGDSEDRLYAWNLVTDGPEESKLSQAMRITKWLTSPQDLGKLYGIAMGIVASCKTNPYPAPEIADAISILVANDRMNLVNHFLEADVPPRIACLWRLRVALELQEGEHVTPADAICHPDDYGGFELGHKLSDERIIAAFTLGGERSSRTLRKLSDYKIANRRICSKWVEDQNWQQILWIISQVTGVVPVKDDRYLYVYCTHQSIIELAKKGEIDTALEILRTGIIPGDEPLKEDDKRRTTLRSKEIFEVHLALFEATGNYYYFEVAKEIAETMKASGQRIWGYLKLCAAIKKIKEATEKLVNTA